MKTNNIPPLIDVQPPTTEQQKPKRPVSHGFVIGLLSLMTAEFAIILFSLATGRSELSLRQLRQVWVPDALFTGGAFALFCLVVGGRHRWAYYVTSGVLGLWALRGVQTVNVYAWILASAKGPIKWSFLDIAEQKVSLASEVIVGAIVAFVIYLFVRFTFSRESRSYFQLKKKTGNEVQAPVHA
jgi:hypothetical protein